MQVRRLAMVLAVLVLPSCTRWDYWRGEKAYEAGDFKTAIRRLTPLANGGFAEAQYALGRMYARGEGVPKDRV